MKTPASGTESTVRILIVDDDAGQRSLLDIFSHTTIREIASSKPSPSFFNRMQTRAAAVDLAATSVKN